MHVHSRYTDDGESIGGGSPANDSHFAHVTLDNRSLGLPDQSNTIQALIAITVAAEVANATAQGQKDADAQMALLRHQTATAIQALKDEHDDALQANKDGFSAQLETTKRQLTAALQASNAKCTALENALAAHEMRASNEAAKLQTSVAKTLQVTEDKIAELTVEFKASAASMEEQLSEVRSQISGSDMRVHALHALVYESKAGVEELNEMVQALYPKLAVLGVSLQKAASKLGEDRVRLAQKAEALRSEIENEAKSQMSYIKTQAKEQRSEIRELAKAQRGRIAEAATAQRDRIASECASQNDQAKAVMADLVVLASRQKGNARGPTTQKKSAASVDENEDATTLQPRQMRAKGRPIVICG